MTEPIQRHDAIVELSDGRTVGYAQYGDSRAPSLIYCHGFASSRLDWQLLQPTVDRHGVEVRVLAIDRPGIGRSTFQPGRSLLDWPTDVAAVADFLGLDRFAVLGVSGGGPYALACAFSMPERVTRLGVAVGATPRQAPEMEDGASMKIPLMNPVLRRLQMAMAAYGIKNQQERFAAQMVAHMSTTDQTVMGRREVLGVFVEASRESYAQGGRANTWEARLLGRPWGFDPAVVGVNAHLWYGGEDSVVPASAGRWLADRIPDSRFVLWPLHGHVTWMVADEAAEVVQTLVG